MGWTFSEIDQHTLHDVAALNLHWKSSPPLHITIAKLLGGGSAPRSASNASARRTKAMSDEEMENERRMLQSLAGTFGNVRQGAVTT